MINQIEIDTSRLVLKSITPEIIHQIFEIESEEAIMLYFNIDGEGYLQLKEMHEKGMVTNRISQFYFLLFDKITDKCIGECGFHTWNRTHARAELFYNLKDDADKRKGLMTETLVKVLEFGFNELELHRIEALTASWNTASIRLLERFKFRKEGTMREDYLVAGIYESSECYSLLKHEF
jgi:ribosomal-protein-alanine N-acetyltransferase